jgi:hypothetical protein
MKNWKIQHPRFQQDNQSDADNNAGDVRGLNVERIHY